MARTKHNHFINTLDDIVSNAKAKGIIHLNSENFTYSGRTLNVDGRDLIHFGSCAYLGFDQDDRLKEAAIKGIRKYGTQWPISNAYVSCSILNELEGYLNAIYGYPVTIAKNLTLNHQAVLPAIIGDNDAIILDHQVHESIQTAVQQLKPRGVKVDLIRHNRLDMLEQRINKLKDKHEKIWYMADGIYSMFGDTAPINEMVSLADKYPQLHLYVDDAHGTSIKGTNGHGYIMNKLDGRLHDRMVLCVTLGKAFGATGGVAIYPNEEWPRIVKNFGGPLTFSAHLEPSLVATAIESAKIHLSDEIIMHQRMLAERIDYCNELLEQTGLPLVAKNNTPIFFIGTGMPNVGFNLIKRLMKKGIYASIGAFPAVPIKNTGIRISVSNHNTFEDINYLTETLKQEYPKALKDEGKTENQVRKAFKLPLKDKQPVYNLNYENTYSINHTTTITDLNKDEWDHLLGKEGTFDYEGLRSMEYSFSDNPEPENNWDFHYFIIRDTFHNPVIATFFIVTLYKDDMLAGGDVSMKIEEERKVSPYHLTSKVISMGTLITEGNHLYINKEDTGWKKAMEMLIQKLYELQDKYKSDKIMLRDFDPDDIEIRDFLFDQGFFKVDMPNANVIDDMHWNNDEEFLQRLSRKNRRNIRKEYFPYLRYFDMEIRKQISQEEADHFYNLYLNVKANNYDINNFPYPRKLFLTDYSNSNWEYAVFYLKPEFDERPIENRKPVAFFLSYCNEFNGYSPAIIGMDYNYLRTYQIYKQALYRIVNHARNKNCPVVYMGYSADFEKRKIGAKNIPKVAYIQAVDNYSMEKIENISANTIETTR